MDVHKYFEGTNILFLDDGIPKGRLKVFKKKVCERGGKVCTKLTTTTTHICAANEMVVGAKFGRQFIERKIEKHGFLVLSCEWVCRSLSWGFKCCPLMHLFFMTKEQKRARQLWLWSSECSKEMEMEELKEIERQAQQDADEEAEREREAQKRADEAEQRKIDGIIDIPPLAILDKLENCFDWSYGHIWDLLNDPNVQVYCCTSEDVINWT